MMDPILRKRYGLAPLGPGGDAPAEGDASGTPKAKGPAANTNELAVINLTIRAVNLNHVKPAANDELAFTLQRAIQASALFDDKESQLAGAITLDDPNAVSFTFPLKIKLRRPIKL